MADTPFITALARLRRAALPLAADSRAIAEMDRQVLERGFFSATNIFDEPLHLMRNAVAAIVSPRTEQRPDRVTPENPAGNVTVAPSLPEIRLATRRALDAAGYVPDPERAGTIQDLGSFRRINLVIEHNAAEAASYGQYVAGQNDAVLDAYPAQELVRFEDRKEPRDWVQTWRAAGGKVYPGGDEATLNSYRLIAAKDDPIWTAISRFGHPWPPFDFGSGMGLRDVSRAEAEELGVIPPGAAVAATRRAFNDTLPEVGA